VRCERCGENTSTSTMSRFNTDTICLPCEQEERGAPGYANARDVELAAVQRGNYNFHGVGLSAADRAYLHERRQQRKVRR
jgi:hypothetical protein